MLWYSALFLNMNVLVALVLTMSTECVRFIIEEPNLMSLDDPIWIKEIFYAENSI